jgi:hypothetical protein
MHVGLPNQVHRQPSTHSQQHTGKGMLAHMHAYYQRMQGTHRLCVCIQACLRSYVRACGFLRCSYNNSTCPAESKLHASSCRCVCLQFCSLRKWARCCKYALILHIHDTVCMHACMWCHVLRRLHHEQDHTTTATALAAAHDQDKVDRRWRLSSECFPGRKEWHEPL